MIDNEKLRYLLVGAANTVFGYLLTVCLYYSLTNKIHTLAILILAHVLAISFSFVTNKMLVFKTENQWLEEYLKYFVVYGNVAVVAIFLTWILTDYTDIPFWICQALVLSFTVLFTYSAHKRYTFKR